MGGLLRFSPGKNGIPAGKGYEGKFRKVASSDAPDDIVSWQCDDGYGVGKGSLRIHMHAHADDRDDAGERTGQSVIHRLGQRIH